MRKVWLSDTNLKILTRDGLPVGLVVSSILFGEIVVSDVVDKCTKLGLSLDQLLTPFLEVLVFCDGWTGRSCSAVRIHRPALFDILTHKVSSQRSWGDLVLTLLSLDRPVKPLPVCVAE